MRIGRSPSYLVKQGHVFYLRVSIPVTLRPVINRKVLRQFHRHPYQFWIPVIALFTGMRQNEIGQRYLENIRQKEGSDVV